MATTAKTDFRNTMQDLAKFTKPEEKLQIAYNNVLAIFCIVYAAIIYPLVHIVYRKTNKMLFTTILCVVLLVIMMVGPLYGWLAAIFSK